MNPITCSFAMGISQPAQLEVKHVIRIGTNASKRICKLKARKLPLLFRPEIQDKRMRVSDGSSLVGRIPIPLLNYYK